MTITHRDTRWRTVDIVVAAALAVAFGVVFVAWNAVWALTEPLFVALRPAQGIIYGIWLLPGVLVGLIVRRPGAAFFGGLLSAVVSMLIGSQWGLDTAVSGAMQGGGAELAFALTMYRRWTLPTAIWAAVLAAAGAVIHDVIVYYRDAGPDFWIVYAAAVVVSAIVIAGVGAWLLMRALAAAGVLGAFEAGREQREV